MASFKFELTTTVTIMASSASEAEEILNERIYRGATWGRQVLRSMVIKPVYNEDRPRPSFMEAVFEEIARQER